MLNLNLNESKIIAVRHFDSRLIEIFMKPKMSADFEKLLDYAGARFAFETLVKRKADPRILEGSLMLIAIFGDVKSDIPWLPPRKVTDSASSAMRALARQIRDLGGYIGADVALREAATSTNIHQADLRIERAVLSELLLNYAEALDSCSHCCPN
jgi:hypothetical protein